MCVDQLREGGGGGGKIQVPGANLEENDASLSMRDLIKQSKSEPASKPFLTRIQTGCVAGIKATTTSSSDVVQHPSIQHPSILGLDRCQDPHNYYNDYFKTKYQSIRGRDAGRKRKRKGKRANECQALDMLELIIILASL